MTPPRTMPRFALTIVLFASGCFFDANYEGARCTTSCPDGLKCHLGACVTSIPIDMMPDMAIDAPPAALTCADPGLFATNGGVAMGTTNGTTSKMASSCGGFVHNGPDRVYRISMNGANQLRVTIDGGRKAYVLASCIESPATPICLGNARATMGNPILVQPAAGFAYVVVDDELATAMSTYTLTLAIQ